MGLPIFSVVIPVYNVEKYIEQCIQSVLDQTFQNFEIICVNDGTKDGSVERIKQFDDARIRIVHQENQGLAAARNTGINHSRGMYIALLDSDDFWAPEKLEKHFDHFQSNSQIDISYAPSLFVDEEGKPMGIGQFPKLKNISPEHIYYRNPVGNGSAAVMRNSFLMRAAEFKNKNGSVRISYFDEQMRQSEDVEFWLRAALAYHACFEGISEPLTYYRVNNEGLSANVEKQFASWKYIMRKNGDKFPGFFKRSYPLAKAYQKRYLARRAIKSCQGKTALHLMHESLSSDWRILMMEPGRTALTYACALLSNLPAGVYHSLESVGMQLFRRKEHQYNV